jgi:TfoX/Sxy family transcriptional regulator of competence genes
MAKWQAPDPELVAFFESALPVRGVERRKMFGCPCAFVNGNMAAGVHEHRLFARLPAEAAAHPFTPMGRASKTYAALEHALDEDPALLRDWIARALAHARTLPPKKKKP